MNTNKLDTEYMLESALRVAEVLSALAEAPHGIRLSDLTKILSINKTTIYRILMTLKSVNFVAYSESMKTYSLGYAIHKMSNKVSETEEVKRVAHPYMEELSKKLGESVILFKRNGSIKFCVDKVDTENVIRRIIEVGEESPLIYSASGRVMLAFMDEEERETILHTNPLEQLTPHTITDVQALREAITRARKDGYSVSNGERLEGVFSVAVPIFTNDGKVTYVIGVAIPEYRVKLEAVNIIIEKIKEYGTKITKALN